MKEKLYKTLMRIKYDKIPNPKDEIRKLYNEDIQQGKKTEWKKDLYRCMKRYK